MKLFLHYSVYCIIRGLGILPFKLLYVLGVVCGHIYWLCSKRDRSISQKNIDLCFAEEHHSARTKLVKNSMIQTAINIFETFWVWSHTPEQAHTKVVRYINLDILQRYEQSTSGTILITAHYGSWEVLTSLLAKHCTKPTYLGKSTGVTLFDDFCKQSRGKAGATFIYSTREGILSMFEQLQKGRLIGIVGDQEPSLKYGKFAPFFGHEALTTLLAQDFAQKTNANVIFASATRLPKGQGFEVQFYESYPEFTSPDMNIACAAMNRMYEHMIRSHPSQYIWNYKRFKTRPEGHNKIY